jgi:hypothetical protein
MKPTLAFFLMALFAAPALATTAACNVDVDVTNTDPHGTNVHAVPGGAVIASLTNPNVEGWVQVHITGQVGDWYEIDRASLINPDLGPEGKTLFHGKGYLHKSVLGVSGMENGGTIYVDHDRKSHPVDPHAAGDQKVEMLGCWGEFLKVHVRKGTGWTTQACTNMDTTCS